MDGRLLRLSTEERQEIYNWLRAFADGKAYRYSALVTRRCHNLLEAILFDREKEPGADKEVMRQDREMFSRVITENGLMLKAGEIADQYVETGAFPPISIADDLLVHGRNLNSFLEKFLDRIRECLRIRGIEVGEAVDLAFYKCVTLFVYAVNDSEILLKQEYQWRLRYVKILPEKEWRKLSVRISCEFIRPEMSNTSYILSAGINNVSELRPKGWTETYAEQGSGPYDRYGFFVKESLLRSGFCPCVRVYKFGDTLRVIPFFYSQELELGMCRGVVNYILDRLDRLPARVLRSVLDRVDEGGRNGSADHIVGQLMNLLCAQIVLKLFLKDAGVSGEIVFDEEKIGRNYGFAGDPDALAGFGEFCAADWTEDDLINIYSVAGLQNSSAGTVDSAYEAERTKYKRVLEDILYEQAVGHERNAKESSKVCISGGYIPPEKLDCTGEMSVNELIGRVSDTHGNVDSPSSYAVVSVLPLITRMMDCGDASLKVRAVSENGRTLIRSAVRNTELSLALYPRRLKEHYDAVYRIARFFRSSDDFPRVMRELLSLSMGGESDQKAQYLEDAEQFAKIIKENSSMADSLLNWS